MCFFLIGCSRPEKIKEKQEEQANHQREREERNHRRDINILERDESVHYISKELLWVRTEKGWVAKEEPIVAVIYAYSYPNPDSGANWLGFPNDRTGLGGYTYLKVYYEVTNEQKIQEAKTKANQWLKTKEGEEAIEKAKKTFHKR